MTITEKIKRIDNEMEQNKAQYNLHSKTAKISAFHDEMLLNINFN